MTELTDAIPGDEHLVLDGKGHRVRVTLTWPAGEIRGGLQLVHGLSEHSERYAELAARCAVEGFVVARHDHRGHGAYCIESELGHFADEGGWDAVVTDAYRVNQELAGRCGKRPVAVLGHSMGSYVAQALLIRHPEAAAALLLSGSTSPKPADLFVGKLLARIVRWRHGRRHRSPFLNGLAFGKFNQRFAPPRTEFDWLSRDPQAVDAYVEDPLCGRMPSAQLWLDLLGGLQAIGNDAALKKIPADLPILITGGSADPVGGRSGMTRLAERYRSTGHVRTTLKLYEGGRHEMLNEINSAEFRHDLLSWLHEALPQPAIA